MSHNINKYKLSAIEAIPEVLEKGKAIQWTINRKNRGTDNIVIAAPVMLENVEEKGKYLVAASVKVSEDNNSLELYEIFYCKVKEETGDTSSTGSSAQDVHTTSGVSSNPSSIISLLQTIDNYNSKNNNNKEFSMREVSEEDYESVIQENEELRAQVGNTIGRKWSIVQPMMEEDGFFDLSGLNELLEDMNKSTEEALKPVKTPQDHKKKQTSKKSSETTE